MSLIKWNNEWYPTLGSVFSDIMDDESFFGNGYKNKKWVPAVNVKETDNSFEIDVAVPGMSKKDFQVTLENGVLNISAEKKEEKEEKEDKYTRKEFSYNSFRRSFTVPQNVNEDNITAKYEDGILKLILDKKEKGKLPEAKPIEVS